MTGDRTPTYREHLSTQIGLTCRVIVGGYLLYLAYGLIDAVKASEYSFRTVMLVVAIVCFILAGAYFVYSSGRDLIIGRYVEGKLDLGEAPVAEDKEDSKIEDKPE